MNTQYGILKMEVSDEIEEHLKKFFNLEQEILEADVEFLPNNKRRLTIKVPAHKGGLIREFILRSIAGLKKENLN